MADGLQVRVDKALCPSPHSFLNKLGRVLWGLAWLLLFRPVPRPLHLWRRGVLRLFGARLGANCRIDPSVLIWAPWNLELGDEVALGHHVDCYNVARVRVGSHATVSQYAFLCSATHDITDPHMRLVSAPIEIGDQAWVCAGAFVGPGIQVGRGAVVAARAVVVKDVAPWAVVGGNPARFLKERVLRDSGTAS